MTEPSEYDRQRQARSEPIAYTRTRKPLVRELVGLLVVGVVLACLTTGLHYRLPAPQAATRPAALAGPAGRGVVRGLLRTQARRGARACV